MIKEMSLMFNDKYMTQLTMLYKHKKGRLATLLYLSKAQFLKDEVHCFNIKDRDKDGTDNLDTVANYQPLLSPLTDNVPISHSVTPLSFDMNLILFLGLFIVCNII